MDNSMVKAIKKKYRENFVCIKTKTAALIFLTMILPTAVWIVLLDFFSVREVLSLMAAFLVLSLAMLAPLARLATWIIANREIRSLNSFCLDIQKGGQIRYFNLPSVVNTDNEMHILKRNLNSLGRLHTLKRELKRTESVLDRYEELAITDELTELYNRRFFEQQLKNCTDKDNGSCRDMYLLLIDADKFKEVNDTMGHQEGDKLLRNLGKIIRTSIREQTDYPCRIGGDEFCIIFTDMNFRQIAEVAERIRKKFEKVAVGGSTLSMGVSKYHCADGYEEDISTMIRLADDAVYAAKRNGGNRIEFNCM